MKASSPATDELLLQSLQLSEQDRFEAAFRVAREAAQRGHDLSQLQVGLCFDIGQGVAADRSRALYWYKRAWKAGAHGSACTNIASVYAAEDNPRRAIFWWRKAVSVGDGDAALAMAMPRWRSPSI